MMKMNQRRLSYAIVLVLVNLMFSGCSTAPLQGYSVIKDPDFEARTAHYSRVAILPATAGLYIGPPQIPETGFSLSDALLLEDPSLYRGELSAQSQRIRDDLDRLVADAIANKGTVIERLDRTQVSDDHVQRIHYRLIEGLYSTEPVDAATALDYRLSVRPAIQPVIDITSADLLVVTAFRGWRRSSGGVAADFAYHMTFVIPWEKATGVGRLTVTLIDAITGDVLWTNNAEHRTRSPMPPDFDAKQLDSMVAEVMTALPLMRQR